MNTHQPITSDMTIAQRDVVRAANYASISANIRAFDERQEARAPGRMYHITTPALEAAAVAEHVSAAYASGDKESAQAAREKFGALSMTTLISSAMNG